MLITFLLSFSYQFLHFQNRNLCYTFQVSIARKQDFALPYFLHKNESRQHCLPFDLRQNFSAALFLIGSVFSHVQGLGTFIKGSVGMLSEMTVLKPSVVFDQNYCTVFRRGSRAAATPKMEWFVIIVNGWKPLTIIIKRSILDVAAALDPPPVFHTGTCIGLNKLVVSV